MDADLALGDNQEEIERIILQNQWTGRACYNEKLCREILMAIRALVKCQLWYEVAADFGTPHPFQPRPQDQERDVFRPRINPDFLGEETA